MVSFINNGEIDILMRQDMRFSAIIEMECLRDRSCTRINAVHVSQNYCRVIVNIFTLRPMEVLHGEFM